MWVVVVVQGEKLDEERCVGSLPAVLRAEALMGIDHDVSRRSMLSISTMPRPQLEIEGTWQQRGSCGVGP
jgi:hypothetical protein